jgi:RNA polymerase sigma-70 factor, ECF subfamily
MESTSVSLLECLREPAQESAWVRFVELYTPLLSRWARCLESNEQDAADLVQDVLAVLVVKLPKFAYQRDGSFRGWLRTVMRNLWADRQRASHQCVQFANSAILKGLVQDDPAKVFWQREYRRALVARALQLMQRDFHPNSWKACWDVVIHGRSPGEVAKKLGMSAGAVHAAKFRILQRLREELVELVE